MEATRLTHCEFMDDGARNKRVSDLRLYYMSVLRVSVNVTPPTHPFDICQNWRHDMKPSSSIPEILHNLNQA